MKHVKLYEDYNDDNLNTDINDVFPYLGEQLIEIISMWNETDKDVDNVMQKLNFIMEGYGVEATLAKEEWNDYWLDTVALYVNMGDENENTIIYDVNKEKFEVTTLEKWITENQNKYDIR